MNRKSLWRNARRLGIAAALGLGSLALGSPLRAQADPDPAAAAPDRTFALEANSGGMAEVKLGRLAQRKGQSIKVKAFGEKMAMDHSKARDDLKGTAQKSGIRLPAGMSRKDQEAYQHLARLEGQAFDQAYAEAMVKDHENDVAAFEREAAGGKDESMKEFARRTLPTLKEHLRLAREMARAVS
jgi:putative membrane protein